MLADGEANVCVRKRLCEQSEPYGFASGFRTRVETGSRLLAIKERLTFRLSGKEVENIKGTENIQGLESGEQGYTIIQGNI